jgi:imidazolonepropionase-like amidohydrolase
MTTTSTCVRRTVLSEGRRAALLSGILLSLVLPPAVAAQTIAITGGRVHPVSGPVIENGTVIIRAGRIAAVGDATLAVPSDAVRVDASGKWVTPGIVNAMTSLGIVEIGAVQETVDIPARGRGDAITASHRVWEGYNTSSPLIQVTRNDGITSVGVMPGGGLVSGQAAVVDLADGSLSDVLLRPGVAMIADIGSKGQDVGQSRAEVLQRLRELILDTRAYMARRADYERNASREMAARRSDLEAMIPVVRGQMPLLVGANRASDIEAAVDMARELNVRIAISGGAEAWRVAGKLAGARIPVIVGALNNIPLSFAMLGARQENAALLQQAGAPVIINGGADAFNARNVRFEAGVAVAFGLPWDAALRAVTLAPAEMFGVADRIGTLQAGRDANVVIWSGDPFEPLTKAEAVYVRGQIVSRPSRQDELMQRYRRLPPGYRP